MVRSWISSFFDQYDTQVGVIGVLAGPAGLRATGWRLDARGASIEPDETVQQTIGQLGSTSLDSDGAST